MRYAELIIALLITVVVLIWVAATVYWAKEVMETARQPKEYYEKDNR